MNHNKQSQGFALVTVFVFCLAAIVIGSATLLATSSTFKATQYQYYNKLAEEAAEAGVTYATSCLENNSRMQTWGPTDYQGTSRPTLKQNTDCQGASSGSISSVVVASDSRLVTEFEVGNLDFSSASSTQVNGVQISAKGYARIKDGSGGYAKTYEATSKKVITWSTSLAAEDSASGANKSCAILSGNTYCWGRNYDGQLGNNSTVDSFIPVKVLQETGVLAGKTATSIFSAFRHNCVAAGGSAYCWGSNLYGQLGTGNTTTSYKPVKVTGALAGKTVVEVGGTRTTSCALISTGKVYCWGDNSHGAVGNNSTTSIFTSPQLVSTGSAGGLPSGYSATSLSVSGSLSSNMCMVANGSAYCWGPDDSGQIGDGGSISTSEIKRYPVLVTGLLTGKTVTSISADGWTRGDGFDTAVHTCAVANSTMYCWGENNYGQLGNNSYTDSSSPVAVSTTTGLASGTVSGVAVGLRHSCGLSNGNMYCWGSNNMGQIGNNGSTSTNYPRPAMVYSEPGKVTTGNVLKVTAGANRGCAITNVAKVFCFGLNTDGQIGDGTQTNKTTPTESLFLRPKNKQYIY